MEDGGDRNSEKKGYIISQYAGGVRNESEVADY